MMKDSVNSMELVYLSRSVVIIGNSIRMLEKCNVRKYIQKFPDWVDNEINNNNKQSLWNNTKGYGGETR
jgi:hypothetical protein